MIYNQRLGSAWISTARCISGIHGGDSVHFHDPAAPPQAWWGGVAGQTPLYRQVNRGCLQTDTTNIPNKQTWSQTTVVADQQRSMADQTRPALPCPGAPPGPRQGRPRMVGKGVEGRERDGCGGSSFKKYKNTKYTCIQRIYPRRSSPIAGKAACRLRNHFI